MNGFVETLAGTVAPAAAMLGLSRSARLPAFVRGPADVAARLRETPVTVVGAGSVGRNAIEHLARLGVGEIRICDDGALKAESVLTHPVPPAEIGEWKAVAAARAARRLCPESQVLAFTGPVEDLPWAALAGSEFVLLATDNLDAELETGIRAARLGIPLFQAAVSGPTLVAQLRCWENRAGAQGPCPACAFGARDWSRVGEARGTLSCERVLAGERAPASGGTPTMSVSFLCGMAGSLLAFEVLRRRLDVPPPHPDYELEIAAYTWKTTVSPLSRNPDCRAPHEGWLRGDAGGGAACDWTLGGLLDAAGVEAENVPRTTVRVEGHTLAGFAACGCGRPSPRRFVPRGREIARCDRCGSPLGLDGLSFEEVGLERLADRLGDRLTTLGVGEASSVLVRGPGRSVLFVPERHEGRS